MSPMRYAYIGYFNGIALTYPPANILCWFACFSHGEFSSSFSETSTSYHIHEIYKQHDLKGQDPPLKKSFQLKSAVLEIWCFESNLYVWMTPLIQRNALGVGDNSVTSIFLWINWPGLFLVWEEGPVKIHISECQMDISYWISYKHPELRKSKRELVIFSPQPFEFTFSPIPENVRYTFIFVIYYYTIWILSWEELRRTVNRGVTW